MKKHLAALSTLLFASLLITGCSSGSPAPESNDSGAEALTLIKIGVVGVIDSAPIYLADDQGFFAEEGLEVELEVAQNGAAISAAVISGDYDFGNASTTPLLQASSRNIPLRVVAGSVVGPPPVGYGDVLVPSDSPISQPKDLAGTTMAVNVLGGVGQVVAMLAAEESGVNPDEISFVAMPFSEMKSAVESGQIGSAEIAEPFNSQARADGFRAVLEPYGVIEDMIASVWFTSADKVEKDSETVQAFQRVMTKANKFAQDNPDALRAIVPTFTKLSAEDAEIIVLPNFDARLDRGVLDTIAEAMLRFGVMESPANIDELLYDVK